MFEDWRPLLYYPLGLLPSIFFTLRILVQWFQSERQKTSYVGRSFWRLSLAGNVLLMLHFVIQVQFPFALLQGGNAVIAWRNLNLMNKENRSSTGTTITLFLGIQALIILLFVAQGYFLIGEFDWIRTPTKLFDSTRQHHAISWHIIGTIGSTLFASRFWVQWWQAERHQRSDLGRTFWWLSIIGSTLSLVYFIHIGDNINILYMGFGLVPYLRNLILIARTRHASIPN